MLRTTVNKKGEIQDEISNYTPTPEENEVREMILRHFVLGTVNMYTPRVEFNDLSLVLRDQYDQMEFNTYQPNNGQAWEGAPQTAWRSRAMRPVVRNKCMSIAAHATARLLFPKIFAFNEDSESQEDAAKVMEDLMEWSGDVSNYNYVALMRVITALSSPASIGYTEYGEVTRSVKVRKEGDKWETKRIRDEAYPCFMDAVVPVDQLYIQNFYEPDIQKQGWLIWRKVYSYSEAQNKYNGIYDNFQYVRPRVQMIYDDANRTFYYVYDPNMRQEDVEEIVYWNKNLDLKIIMVSGVMLTEYDNPNPRQDKLYPFDKFFYEPITNRFFYGKSLAFKLQHDADIVNTLYQMVIDGTYLSIFKPMVNVGGEIIASDVIVPGAVTTLSDPNADLRAISVGADLKDGLATLQVVEQSITETAADNQTPSQNQPGQSPTAYEISVEEQRANTLLGLFLQMIAKHVKDFGKLRVGDIVQYLTLPEVAEITGDAPLTYKTFALKKPTKGVGQPRQIRFENNMPENITLDEYLDESYKLLGEEEEKKLEISRVNPELFRELQYVTTISADILNPRSEDLERAYGLEDYDRMVAAPPGMFDPENTARLLLDNNPRTKKDPDKYLAKQPSAGSQPMLQNPVNPNQNGQGQMPNAGNSPLKATMGKNTLNKGLSPTPPLAPTQGNGIM